MTNRKVPGIRRLVRRGSTQGQPVPTPTDYPGVVRRYDKLVGRLHDIDETVQFVAEAFSDRRLVSDWEAIRNDFTQLRRLVSWLDGTGEMGPDLVADFEGGLCSPGRVTLVFDSLEGAASSIDRLADLLPDAADHSGTDRDRENAVRRVTKNRRNTLHAVRVDMRSAIRGQVTGADRDALGAVEAAMVDVLSNEFFPALRAILDGMAMEGRVPALYERGFILPTYPTHEPSFVSL